MKIPRQNELGHLAAVAAAAIVSILLIASSAEAGTARARAHVHDSCGVSCGTATGDHTASDLNFAVADSMLDAGYGDVPGAHARAWASAVVFNGIVFKSTGGEGWVTNGNDPKHHYWRAIASTGTFEVLGSAGEIAELRVRIRQSRDPEVIEHAQIAQPANAPPEVGPEYPSQGFFAEHDLQVFFSLDVSVDTGNGPMVLFAGDATLNGPASPTPGLDPTGDLIGVFAVDQNMSPSGELRLEAFTPTQIISLGTITTPVGTPFELNFDQLLTDNRDDLDETPFLNEPGRTLVTSGQMVVELFALDQSGAPLDIRAIVPEPSALILAVFAAAGMLAYRPRRARAL